MASQTPLFGIPYPVGTDRVMDGDDSMRSLAQRVEDRVGGALVAVMGPAGQMDCGNPAVTVLTANVAMRAGHRYKITCSIQGTPINVLSSQTLARIGVDASADLFRPINLYSSPLNQVVTGTGAIVYVNATDATRAVTLSAQSSTASSAFRVSPNAASLIVEDLGAF